MSVAVRGRLPVSPDGKFTGEISEHIKQRLIALEKAVSGSQVGFLNPTYPAFGGGNQTVASGGGTAPPTTTTNTTIVQTGADTSDLFLLMGA